MILSSFFTQQGTHSIFKNNKLYRKASLAHSSGITLLSQEEREVKINVLTELISIKVAHSVTVVGANPNSILYFYGCTGILQHSVASHTTNSAGLKRF